MSSSTAAAATDPTDDSGPPAIVDTAINTMAQSQSTLEDDGSTMTYSSVRHITSAHDGQPLSTETLLEGDGSSGQVQLYVENDVDTPPDNRIKFIIFLAKTIGIDVESDLKDIADRRGKKKLVQFTKTVLYREIMRRDPNAKVNKNNTSLDAMWNLLPALTDERDVVYIRSQYSSIRQRLVEDVEEREETIARRQDTDVWRFFLLIPKFEDLRRAYAYSQTPSHREMLDGRETYKSRFLKLMVQYFNDSNISVSTPSQPSLHSCFSEPILCDKGDFELTEEKAKKILADSRRHLTTMINDWERSGNGSNQQRLEEDFFDELGDFDTWGRFDPGTCDGDDRSNFLRHLPCLFEITPGGVSRGSGTSSASKTGQKTAQQTYELQKELVSTVKDIGKAVAKFSDDTTYERASKIRRLDMLKDTRYEVYKDSKSKRNTAEERAVAAEYVKDLDERIATMEMELAVERGA
eukprot:g8661.t1 g8661   contig3:638798-640275(-)